MTTQNKDQTKNQTNNNIRIGEPIDIDNLPKRFARLGLTVEIERKLENLPIGKAIPIVFEKKTVAGGYWKIFKSRGYYVSLRKGENNTWILYIGKQKKQ